MEIKDSGSRRTFPGGGVRDMAEGKGACHLLPLDIMAEWFAYLSKEEQVRYSGAAWMVRYAEEHGLEAAKKELEQRGIRQIPLAVSKADLDRFSQREKMNRFIRRFNSKTECIVNGYVNWKDMQQTIKDETGLFIPLPDEFLEMGEE